MATKNDCLLNFRASRALREQVRLAAKELGISPSAYLRYMAESFSLLELYGETFTAEDFGTIAGVAKMRGNRLGILEVLDLLSKKRTE